MGIGTISLTACYAFLPSGRRHFISQLPGAVVTTVACAVLSFAFHVYVDHFCKFTTLYGSIATVALLLFWMYIVSLILIACGFLNRLLDERDPRERRRGASHLRPPNKNRARRGCAILSRRDYGLDFLRAERLRRLCELVGICGQFSLCHALAIDRSPVVCHREGHPTRVLRLTSLFGGSLQIAVLALHIVA